MQALKAKPGPVAVNLSTSRMIDDVAARFGISRTHVRITLQQAQEAGLIHMSEQSIVMLPPLVAAFERFVADVMAGHDFMFRAAMREIAGLGGNPPPAAQTRCAGEHPRALR